MLPHNRPEVFSTVFRNRLGYICSISALAILFFIPLAAIAIYFRSGIREIYATLLEDESNKLDVIQAVFGATNFKCLIELIGFAIAGLGLGGAFSCFSKLTLNEIVFVSDFFTSFKKINWLKFVFFGLFLGVSFWIFSFTFNGIPCSDLSGFPAMICYGFCITQLLLVFVFVAYLYMQNNVYTLQTKYLFSNAFKFTIKTFFQSLGFISIILLPYALVLFENVLTDIAVVFVMFFFLPLGLIPLVLFIQSRFDKYINKDLYPDFVDKGFKRN